MRIFRTVLVASLIMLACGASTAYGASWPMFQRDAQNTGFNQGESIKLPLELSWIKWPEKSYSERRTRPVVADGTIYVGQSWNIYDWSTYVRTEGQLQAISLATGKPVWTVKEMLVSGTPALSNGRIYFGTQEGKFYALNAGDGTLIWSFDAGGRPTAPALFGHEIYFGTHNGKVYALNAGTGTVRWVLERSSLFSAPAVADGTLFVGGSEVLAVDLSNGNIKWSFRDIWGSHSAPVVRGKSVFVSCPYMLHCLSSEDGGLRWSYFTGNRNGSAKTPSISDSTLYWGTVVAIDPETGRRKWTFESENDVGSASVAVANGYVFVGSSHYYLAGFDHSDGRLYVLKEDSGELVWQYLAGRHLNDWYLIDPSPAVAEGSVVLNLSTRRLCRFSVPERPSSPLAVSASGYEFDPYDGEGGRIDFSFKLDSPARVTAEILDYRGGPVRRLIDGEAFEGGEHSITWYGLIDFPEMADTLLREEFGDGCVLIAPDGDYRLLVTVEAGGGQSYTGSIDVKVKSDV